MRTASMPQLGIALVEIRTEEGFMKLKRAPLVLSVREVAEILRIHRPKVYDLINGKILDGFKLGADWRVRRDSVEKLTGPLPDDYLLEVITPAKKDA